MDSGRPAPTAGHFLADRLLGALGCVVAPLALAGRWEQYSRWEASSYLVMFLFCATLALLPLLRPHFYSRHRVAILLLVKGLRLVLPLACRGVRLDQPATASLRADLSCALVGLRLLFISVGGLLPMPCTIWLMQQLVSLAGVLNLEQDCRTELLAHPVMAERIGRFHRTMALLAAPLLPQAALLTPQTPLGQCKAAVSFWAALLCLLLPGLLLTVPGMPWVKPQPDALGDIRSLDRRIEGMLAVLRYKMGLAEQLVTGWLVLVMAWATAVLVF